MQVPKDSGLDALGKIVRRSMDYYSGAFKALSTGFKNSVGKENGAVLRLPSLESLRKSAEAFLAGLNNATAQFARKPERINYNAIVSSFLPPGARLLKPQYPEGSNEIQFADLDGDRRSEMVASYKTVEGIKTLILKKDELQWYKQAEISNPDFEEIHYRNSADMAGDGRDLLLLGLISGTGARTIFAYSLSDGTAKKIFSKKYSLLELQKPRRGSGKSGRAVLAFWNETSPGIYDIEIAGWNGLELEQRDSRSYLAGKVIPYYIRKLRQNPSDTASWYNLASVMEKTGDRANAEIAIKLGLQRNPGAELREKFNALKSRL